MHLGSLRQQDKIRLDEASKLSDLTEITQEINTLKSDVKISLLKENQQKDIMNLFTSAEKIDLEGGFTLKEGYIIENNGSKQLPINKLSDEAAEEIAAGLVNNTLNMAA